MRKTKGYNMSLEQDLINRSNSSCELCSSSIDLKVYEVAPSDGSVDQAIMLCGTCNEQILDDSKIDANHFRCLNDSMWSEVPAVQVMAYRVLNKIKAEGWPQELLDMLYLEDATKEWADAGIEEEDEDKIIHKDSNGVILAAGDTVTIIKDLEVKGAGFTAKRGTAVRNITLTTNPEQIEGRVNGTKIVLLTCFLKKS